MSCQVFFFFWTLGFFTHTHVSSSTPAPGRSLGPKGYVTSLLSGPSKTFHLPALGRAYSDFGRWLLMKILPVSPLLTNENIEPPTQAPPWPEAETMFHPFHLLPSRGFCPPAHFTQPSCVFVPLCVCPARLPSAWRFYREIVLTVNTCPSVFWCRTCNWGDVFDHRPHPHCVVLWPAGWRPFWFKGSPAKLGKPEAVLLPGRMCRPLVPPPKTWKCGRGATSYIPI